MKKVLVLAMVAVMTLSIAGCGKAKETEEATIVEASVEEVEEAAGDAIAGKAEAETETDGTSSDSSAMDLYIELSQSTFDAMAESLKGVMEFKASGDGNTLKYEMKILTDMGDTDAMKEQADVQMEAQKEQMEMVVEGLKAAGVEDPKFIVEYSDKDGNVIATYNFE